MEAISKECGTERKMQTLLGEHKALLEETSCRQKLQWFGHVSSRQGTLMHTAMHGVAEGNRGRARPRLTWIHGISNWTNRSVIECVLQFQFSLTNILGYISIQIQNYLAT